VCTPHHLSYMLFMSPITTSHHCDTLVPRYPGFETPTFLKRITSIWAAVMAEYFHYPDFVQHRCKVCQSGIMTVFIGELSSNPRWKSRWDFLRGPQQLRNRCTLHRFRLACMSWINATLLEDDGVIQLQVTGDGLAQVISTIQEPKAKHLILECVQVHGRCSNTPPDISANEHRN
jgi:hypothetical protein